MRKKWIVAVAALLVLAAAGTTAWFARTRPTTTAPLSGSDAPAEVSLKPTRAGQAGVAVTSGFLLTAEKPIKPGDLKQHLQVEPAAELVIEERSAKEFLITPATPLEANRIYRFKLAAAGLSRPYQWSFQTQAAFRILGTLPRDQAAGVPANTGIEIIFSHENFADPGALFAISPAVAGRFERHKKTLVFAPTEPLKSGTIYAVTLKAGLALTGTTEKLTQDFRFTFETEPNAGDFQGGGRPMLSVPEELAEYAAGEAPYFPIYTNDKNQKLDVTVHRYKDAGSFAAALSAADKVPWWANWARARYLEPTAGLTQVAAFQGQPKEYEQYGTFLHLPEALPPGYYIATLKVPNEARQIRFQVTDLSSYAVVSTTKTLVWLNDLATGKPVAGARVSMIGGGGGEAASGADGVATLSVAPAVPDGNSPAGVYLHVQAGDREALVALPWERYYRYSNPGTGKAVQYWRYLYLDRQLYRPDDTINLWGVVRPREPGAGPATEVTAIVTRGGYYDDAGQPVPLAKAVIPVNDSTYTGELALPGLRQGWYELQVRLGDEPLSSRYFEVQSYVKPAYRLDASLSKRAVFAGDPVDLTVKASFFEGTPVPNLSLTYNLQKDGQSMTTGADGTATVTLRPEGHGYGGVDSLWYNVHATLPEAGEIDDSGWLMVYNRDVLLQSSVKVEEGRAVVTGQINRVALDAINSGDGWDDRGAPVPGRQVELVLTEQHWDQVEIGTYYDFISKKTRKQYDYRPNHKQVGTFTALSGQGGAFSHTLTIDPEQSYTVKVTVKDSKDRPVTQELWFSGRWYQGFEDRLHWGRWHHLATSPENRYTFALGEPIALEMRREQAQLPDRPGGFLFYTARLGLQEYRVQNDSRFTYTLKESDLPSTSVGSVYFDGRSYFEAGPRVLRFDPQERALRVEVVADRPAYRPGDTVNLTVIAADRTGRPVRAQVNLNLVDEAIYALREQHVDLLDSLYSEYMPTGILRTRGSHQVPVPNGGAEKGGDGGGARKDFKDAVYFATVTTDAQGRASASFKVPDNLTTWRVTWQALVPETMEAASGTTGVAVKLPFFVETVQAETYLTGDRPVVTARTYGAVLKADQTARVSAALDGPDKWQSADLVGRAFDPLGLRLPALSEPGTYALTVRAEGPAGLTDAVEKPITVVDSYLTQKRVGFKLVEEGSGIAGPETGLVTVLLSDYERGRYFRLLQQARWQGGSRLEQKLARLSAQGLMKTHFAQEGDEPAFDTYAYQTENGGIAYLPYADADLHLTALAADLAPERFDAFALEQFFLKVLDDDGESRERKLMALYGMATLDRPVLLPAQQWAGGANLSLIDQLYLALTMAELGDLEGARPLYRAVLSVHGEQLGADARIKTGRDQDEILMHTALAGMLAAKLGEPAAPAFAGYLLANRGSDVLLAMEQAIIANDGLPRLTEKPVALTFMVDGKATRLELKPGQTKSLLLTAKQAATLQFSGIQGKVGAAVIYEAPIGRGDLKQREGFSVARSYSVVGGANVTDSFKAGDLVKVTLNVKIPETAPGGAYELTDYLPSGLRIVARPWQHGIKWGSMNDPAWPLDVSGQKATFWVGRDSYPISYYARVVTAGEYTAEEPVLQHSKSGLIYASGPRMQVNIE
ncbi:MAG TPA: Ig-like domain-containing protein [Symbiobacteriaceae bacterium]|nr:Ig-like domain-containing protein [Symbiobacteriaceae bacterium]